MDLNDMGMYKIVMFYLENKLYKCCMSMFPMFKSM